MKYFDLHCDTLYECYEMQKQLRENDLFIDRSKVGGYDEYVQFFALFCGALPPEPIPGRRSLTSLPETERLDAMLQTAREQFLQNRDWLYQCFCAEDLQNPERRGRAAAFLSIEGAELLSTEQHLQRAYDAGVRMVTLSWNGANQYACGAAADNSAGLTARGRALVHELVRMGVIIDVSHLSDAELEIMKIIWPETRKPIRFAWILEELSARGKAWQPNTLITLLGRLTNKGFLSVTKVGRKNEYTPLISEADYQSAQTQTFLHKVYRGDAKGLVMALIQRDLLSAGDYEDLRRFWEQEEK